jgi:hypothetical protein
MPLIRNYLIVCISLISMFVNMFFLAELQEVGPLLLSPFTGDNHLSCLNLLNHAIIGVPAQDHPNMSTTYQPPVSPYSPDLLLIALAKYVGVLGARL